MDCALYLGGRLGRHHDPLGATQPEAGVRAMDGRQVEGVSSTDHPVHSLMYSYRPDERMATALNGVGFPKAIDATGAVFAQSVKQCLRNIMKRFPSLSCNDALCLLHRMLLCLSFQ